MDEINVDMVIDIPDTPDRVGARRMNGREGHGKERVSSAASRSSNTCFVDEECCNGLGNRGRVAPGSGKIVKHHLHHRKNSYGETESSNNLHALGNGPLFRRAAIEKGSRHENRHALQHMDKGKAICTKFLSKPASCLQNVPVIDLNQRSAHQQSLEIAHPYTAAKSFSSGENRGIFTTTNGGSSLCTAQNSSDAARKANKGKEKIGDNTCRGAEPATDREMIDLSSESHRKKENQMSSSHRPVIRVPGQKRLVRNGCISPHGIAAKAKELAQNNQNNLKDKVTEQSLTGKTALHDRFRVDIRDIVSEGNISYQAGRTSATVHPHASKDKGGKNIELLSRDVARDTHGSDRWRSTRNHQKKIDNPMPDINGSSLSVGNNVGRHVGQHHETGGSHQNGTGRTISLVPEGEELRGLFDIDEIATKRQRKNGLTLEDNTAGSAIVSDELEISILGSSGKPSSSRISGDQNCQGQGALNPVFEIDDSSREVKPSCSQGGRRAETDESAARARQLEADEMLARELQEQFYQDEPILGDEEINESVAWALQEEDNSLRASSSQNRRRRQPISSIPSSRGQTRARLLQNSSNRRTNLPRARASTRMTRAGGHLLGRSPAGLHRAWNLHFPTDMALDVRLDILEELEAAVEQLSDSMSRTSRLLQVERDFNENDYEMLLALDENNHRHGGASVNQINSLPESTVQTDNFEEACAICLETPTIGDIIRHLPCLHKFHKDCIDPWLGRSKQCPVCKSSIT